MEAAGVEVRVLDGLSVILDEDTSSATAVGFEALLCAFSSPRAASILGWFTALKDEASPPPFRTSTMENNP